MKAQYVLPACLLLACASLSWCQSGAGTSSSGSSNNHSSSILSGGINLRSIAGIPFSADVVQESTQLQTDGSRIAIETYGKMFRDSAGRTRSETEIAGAATGADMRHYVTIFDPVEQLNIRLDAQTKTATLFPFPTAAAQLPPDVELKLAKALARNAQATRQQDLVAAQDLGPATMQGFAVTGVRRALPAEAKAAGSEKARNVAVETWFSPELKIELQSRTDDPPLGVRTTKLVNIINAEPDPALFRIPADYAIADYRSADYTTKNNSLRK
ncbi:MAG TPA: hypothetical protein VH724_15025 [Candidatus Angelobacter sp.]|nr:hypothetical protein [Candidatus Angelobacter sp.]